MEEINFNAFINFNAYISVIGYGESTADLINEIREASYKGLKTAVIPAGETINPSEDDEMAIIICDDTQDGINELLGKLHQTGLLVILISTKTPVVYGDSDLYDSLTIVRRDEIVNVSKTLLDPVFLKGPISFNLEDFDFTLRASGRFVVRKGYGRGANRMKDAIASISAMANLEEGAERVSLLIHYNSKELVPPLMIEETVAITDFVSQLPSSVDIIWAIYNDPALDSDTLGISLIAAGKNIK